METHSWTTEFTECGTIMTHKFENYVYVQTDIVTGISKTFKDGTEVGRIDTTLMNVKEYEGYLLRVEQDARELTIINLDKA